MGQQRLQTEALPPGGSVRGGQTLITAGKYKGACSRSDKGQSIECSRHTLGAADFELMHSHVDRTTPCTPDKFDEVHANP